MSTDVIGMIYEINNLILKSFKIIDLVPTLFIYCMYSSYWQCVPGIQDEMHKMEEIYAGGSPGFNYIPEDTTLGILSTSFCLCA